MSDLIQFPFTRNSYPALDNPVYIQDTQAANQEILTAIQSIANLGNSDFAIFSGLVYTIAISGVNFYTPGIFFLDGVWYYQPDEFDEGEFLSPNITGIMDYTFSDSVERPTYNVNYSKSGNTGTTPAFTGNMNQYRLDLKSMGSNITVLQLAVALQNVQHTTLGSTFSVNFTNDKAHFFASATVNTIITFDLTGAIPGTVITLKWTFASTETLTVTAGTGQTVLKESGELALAANNTNIMSILFVGLNELGEQEIRYVLSQPA